jgi:hypothetical protein
VRFLPRAAFGPRGTDARLDLTAKGFADKNFHFSGRFSAFTRRAESAMT